MRKVTTTIYTGATLKISPNIHLPSSITTTNPSLSTFNAPVVIVIVAATESTATIGFRARGSTIAYTLGGTQHGLAAAFASGIIPADTGLDLPHLQMETEANKQFLLHIPQAIKNAPAKGLKAFINAAKAQKVSPYNQEDFPSGGREEDEIAIKECVKVFTTLKRKFAEIEKARPTKMRMLVASRKPKPHALVRADQRNEAADAIKSANHEAFVKAAIEMNHN